MRRAMTAAVPVLVLALSPATAGAGSLDRETFYYPGGQRRDPFEPLSAGDELGPRFEDLNLSGIVYSPTTGSIAVLTDRATGKRYRVWEGDLIGGAKLVRVRASEVDFVVSAFGVSRQETLRLKSQDKEQGG
ncbi:MAG: hypothetical protein P8125_06595 [Gemmatimonadota bacterium]